MRRTTIMVRLLAAVALVSLAACQDTSEPLSPEAPNQFQAADRAGEALQAVMALDRTVFGGYDASGRLVIGVEDAGINRGVAQVLERFGMGPSDYDVQVTDPIHMLSDNLRSVHRPTRGGIQIHFGNYLCTLGFNVDHAGGRSFITNSHCTDRQGGVDGTLYYQPVSSVDPDPIAVEVDDPGYFKGGECSRGKQCRYSDAARAQYNAGIDSNGEIAKTDGVNSGSLNVVGSFDITSQDDTNTSFSGTVHKVGRTTGWGAGTVTASCVTVNVSGSNIQLLCQTLVQSGGATIVGGGDSGSPVFRQTGSNTAQLLGILWGGNSAGDLFVFSPLKSIQDELGDLDATTDGTGTGDGGDGGDGGDCTPRGNSGQCK
jgi:hypothetical protein